MFSFNFLSDNNLNNIYLDIFQSKLNSWKLPKLILRLPSKIQTFPRLLPVHPSVFFGYDFELVVGRSLKIGFRLYLRAKCMTLSNLPGSRIQENCCLCVRGFLDSWVPGDSWAAQEIKLSRLSCPWNYYSWLHLFALFRCAASSSIMHACPVPHAAPFPLLPSHLSVFIFVFLLLKWNA